MNKILFLLFFHLIYFSLPAAANGSKRIFSGILKSSSDSVIVKAGSNYKVSKFKSFFFGRHYRKEWNTPVKMQVFDLAKSGLKVVKQGGSRQTISLRLVDSTGKEFVLRSIDKAPYQNLPPELRETILADVLQDQVSTAHPYAAFTIPRLAKAAGVYHTQPVLVYIPEDSAFGEFASVLGNKPALFEERPDGPMPYAEHFGNPPDVIGTDKMLSRRFRDNDAVIDEQQYLRSRLFDMLLGDWSRHEDQWRWGVFPQSDGKIFKPIPRDRDHVFFKFDGLLPQLISQPWGVPHLRNYDDKIKGIKGLNNSARNIDRIILTRLSEDEWVTIAKNLQQCITDQVIWEAITSMPSNVFPISGPEIIRKLKARRDRLPEVALKYYRMLAEEVDIYGSDKHERFEVNRISNELTEVKVYKINKEGELKELLYQRTFKRSETKEIRLYGLKGFDVFEIKGKAKKGIKVRAIGGQGIDKYLDSSYVKSGRKKTKLYDTKKYKNIYFYHKETRDVRSDKVSDSLHVYPHNYTYNYAGPFLYPEYNVDDGLFIGAGFIKRSYGFNKYPYSRLNKVGINLALGTGAYTFKYYGDFRKIIRNWSLSLDAGVFGPRYVTNYFGFGNETKQAVDKIEYYRIRMKEIIFEPMLYREVTNFFLIGLGPVYQGTRVEKTPERFVATSEAALSDQTFTSNHFVGIKGFTRVSTVENHVFPENGFKWSFETRAMNEFKSSRTYFNINSSLVVYLTLKVLPKFLTVASRVGGATNFGEYYFYQANTLGGTSNLRGYRRTRFYGNSMFYHNNELRIKLLKSNTYLMPVRVGALAFFDYGRVWAENEKSNKWHQGYGPGLWIEIYNRYIFSGTYGISEEGNQVNVELGFLF